MLGRQRKPHPAAAGGLQRQQHQVQCHTRDSENSSPCNVQARWEAVSRERAVERREGVRCWQPHGFGRLGGGKT